MGNQHTDGAGVDGAAERPNNILSACPQRSADAHLGNHHGRQDRPQSVQRNGQDLREGERQQGGNRHPQTEAELGFIRADLNAGLVPRAWHSHCP